MHDANAASQTVTRATEAAERAGARARPAIMQSTWALSTLNEDQSRRIFENKSQPKDQNALVRRLRS
eukprot:COSAG02_NODE_3592_length_6515_cov_5.044576_7_plen_67_part_00